MFGNLAEKKSLFGLRDIREELGMDLFEFSRLMQLSVPKYLYYANFKKDFPLESLHSLSNALNISVERLCTGAFDLVAVQRQFAGDVDFVSDRYLVNPYSKVRTIISALQYTSTRFHPAVIEHIRKELQLPAGLSKKMDEGINIEVLNNIFELIEKCGALQQDYFRIGQKNATLFAETALGEILSTYRNRRYFWEALFETNGGYAEMVDKNFNYELVRLDSQKAHVKMTSREWAREYYNCDNYGHYGFAYNGAGFTSTIGILYQGKPCDSRVLKCFAQGDSHNLLEINFG